MTIAPFDHTGGLAALDHPGPLVMGVLNTTPDSFSDGGSFVSTELAVQRAHQMLSEGAHIIDIGGESSRPGADPVSVADELARVIPVVEQLAGTCVLSIDTAKEEVADAALEAGAHLVNDITASLEDVAAHHGAGWIAMHMLGKPRTMQDNPTYGDVIAEIRDQLADAANRATSAGLQRFWLDPGIGFGKSTKHNLNLLRDLDLLTNVGHKMAIGVSRKRFIGQLHAASDGVDKVDVGDRLAGSVLCAAWAYGRGVHIVRAHDVRATVRAAALITP